MDEIDAVNCPGTYKYVFTTFDVSKKYVARIDGGVGTEDRYRTLQLRTDAEAVSDYMDSNSTKLDMRISEVVGARVAAINTKEIIDDFLKRKIGERTVAEILEQGSTQEYVGEVGKFITEKQKEKFQYTYELIRSSKEGVCDSMKEMIGGINFSPVIEFNEENIVNLLSQVLFELGETKDSLLKKIEDESDELEKCVKSGQYSAKDLIKLVDIAMSWKEQRMGKKKEVIIETYV